MPAICHAARRMPAATCTCGNPIWHRYSRTAELGAKKSRCSDCDADHQRSIQAANRRNARAKARLSDHAPA
jgi:hypothetical protein